MTAFLIESYKNLQQDTGAIAVQLLSEIAAQGRNLTKQQDPSTTGTTVTSSPFEPPAAAVRVNALWFASLCFSLITASFAMMVKQWLHEYLASGGSGAQTRLRIRHFKLSGVLLWKVFEIAALLPLLLQLALGLFLVGLCFFARSIHPVIWRTCVPLVGTWAGCLLLATLAPVWSARCPYRIPFLTDLLNRVRPLLRSAVLELRHAFRVVRWRIRRARHRPRRRSRMSTLNIWNEPRRPRRSDIIDVLGTDEERIATTRRHDFHILWALDRELLDNDLLEHQILDAMLQTDAWGDDIVEFVMDALRRRLQDIESLVDVLPADLRSAPEKVWDIASGAALDILQVYASGRPDYDLAFTPLRSVVLLLFSFTSSEHWKRIKPSVFEVVSHLLKSTTTADSMCSALASAARIGVQDDQVEGFLQLYFKKLSGLLPYIGGERAYRVAEQIVGRRIHSEDTIDFGYNQPCTFRLSGFRSSPWRRHFTPVNMLDVSDMVNRFVRAGLEESTSDHCAPWLAEALTFVVEANTIDIIDRSKNPLDAPSADWEGDPIILVAMHNYQPALETLRAFAQLELEVWSTAWKIRQIIHDVYLATSGLSMPSTPRLFAI